MRGPDEDPPMRRQKRSRPAASTPGKDYVPPHLRQACPTTRAAEEEEELDESEELWQDRIAKRQQDVAKVKALPVYQKYQNEVPNVVDRAWDDPQTPRWAERIPKRRWKKEVEQWRADLRTKYNA